MLKKWKKSLKFLCSVVIFLVYVTVDRYNRETLRVERNEKSSSGAYPPLEFSGGPVPSSEDKFFPAMVKTIVGYSREFKLKQELNDWIRCGRGRGPEVIGSSGEETGNAGGKWRRDEKLGIYLYSAYYDARLNPYYYVRIVGLVPRNMTFYCQLWYNGSDNVTSQITQKAVVREIWSKSWGQSSQQCGEVYPSLISCLAPTENGSQVLPAPSWVSFVDETCANDGKTFLRIRHHRGRGEERGNFLICVKPLHFTSLNVKTFQEWLEINHRLGAEKIVVYLSNATHVNTSEFGNLSRILVVKRFDNLERPSCPGSIQDLEETIWHRRKMEIIAYNDCFYSHLNDTEFVIPLDVDEIIVPKTGNSWYEEFSSHFRFPLRAKKRKTFPPENFASFSARNAYFFSDYPTNAVFFPKPEPLKLPKTVESNVPIELVSAGRTGKIFRRKRSIFDRTLRSYRLSPRTDSVKSFVRVSKSLTVFNHYAFHVLDEDSDRRQYVFPETVFQLNHYRNSCDPLLIDGCEDFLNRVVFDDSLEKFRSRT